MWVDDLEVGMQLATVVRSAKGQVLLGEGMILTARHLSLLKSWGIDEVDVVDEPQDETEGRFQVLDDGTQLRLQRAFAHVTADATMDGFWRWAVRRFSEGTPSGVGDTGEGR